MKKNNLVSVILFAENSDKNAINLAIKDILKQTHNNIEIIVPYFSNIDYSELQSTWLQSNYNIFWIPCENIIEILQKPYEKCSGDFIFYKSLNNNNWLLRHVEHHIDILSESKLTQKWSYSLLEIKDINGQEPLNNVGWRIDFPRQEQLIIDELSHTSDIKIDWIQCLIKQEQNTIFTPGLVLKQLKNYHLIIPKEITITFYIGQQQSQQTILGSPATDEIKENIIEVNNDLEILKCYPTIVGNVQFSDRNKNILKNIDNDKIYKIAVKRSMGMGDVLMVEPVIRALKNKYKNAKVTMFTTNYTNSDKIANLFSNIDEVKIIEQDKLAIDYLAQFSEYNLKFDLDLSYESRPGFRYIDGYLEVCGFEEALEEINNELIITRGIKNEDLTPKLNYNPIRLINENYVTLSPEGSGWNGKQWNVDNWKILITKLLSIGYKVVMTSNVYKNELKDFNVIFNDDNDFYKLLNYIAFSKAQLSADNGPMHIASAFNVPCFIISGAALTRYTTPYSKIFAVEKQGLECLGCKHKMFYENINGGISFVPKCTNNVEFDCMRGLDVDYVSSKLEEFLKLYNIG